MKKIKRSFLLFGFAVLLVSCVGFLIAISASAKTATNDYYLSENSNVDTIHATTVGAMPCIGEAKILVFYTDFGNEEINLTKTKEEVEDLFFSEKGKIDSSLAYSEEDSLRSYYYRSSYGKLDITGSVFEYQAKNDITYYENLYMVLDEIIEHYEDAINWNEYDGNGDGYIDGIYVVSKQYHSWADASWVQGYWNEVDDKTFALACLLQNDDLSTICHETCHMFGIPDMYSKVNLNNGGLWTASIMDYGQGDLPSPAKFVLGWLDNATFISSESVGTFDVRSYTNYGDVLIVYPGGNKGNRNWFFIEYVTKEGNNNNQTNFVGSPDKYGVRVWKTQMMLDEDYDVIGEAELAAGWIPTPFEYLEAIHPDDIRNYYMQVGDKITPYTYPSTAYSDTFYSENSDKFLKDLTFSGINIEFVNLEEGIATIDVQIEKEADITKTANGTITALPIEESSDFIDNKNSICFAKLSSNIEFKSNENIGEITIKSESSNIEYPLEKILSINKRDVQLYITVDILKELRKQTDWKISATGLTTYCGASVTVENREIIFDFLDYPLPIVDSSEQYNTDFNMTLDKASNTDIKYFKLSNSTLLTIYFDDIAKKLYWGEINHETNKTAKYELQLPKDLNIDEIWNVHYFNKSIMKWKDYNKYFVYIGNYICCYSDKELVSYFDLSNIDNNMVFKGSDNNSLFLGWSDCGIYKMTFSENKIAFNTISFELSSLISNPYDVYSIYGFIENQYVIASRQGIYFIDIEKNIVKKIANDAGKDFSAVDIYFFENNYYVFSSSIDLKMSRFDTNFNLVEESNFLNNLSSTMNELSWINVDFNYHSWIIHFECASKLNSIGMNTYLIVCDSSGHVINYHKYYDSWDVRPNAYFIPLSENELIGIDFYSYKHVNIGCGNHSFNDWVEVFAPTCTEVGTARRDCNNCEYYQIKEVSAVGHSLNDWVETLAPTCIKEGYNKRSCAKCDYFETQDIPRLAHSFSDWIEVLAPTCTEKGAERRDCSECDYFETKDIRELGHHDIDNDEVCDLCGWKETTLSVGAVVGIVIGSVAAVGVVGLSLLRFVIKKKRISDLSKK